MRGGFNGRSGRDSKSSSRLLKAGVRFDEAVVLAGQRAREVAGMLGFKPELKEHIATAVSEIVRNAFRYAGGGTLEFSVIKEPIAKLRMILIDQGPGIANLQMILDGKYISKTGMGLGIRGAK